MSNGLVEAISAIEKERGIDEEILYEAISEALKKAYRNHYGTEGNVRAEVDRETGEFKVFSQREVIEEVEDDMDPNMYISLEEARKLGDFGIGDIVEEDKTPDSFGRVAAQTAKQVLLQRLKCTRL